MIATKSALMVGLLVSAAIGGGASVGVLKHVDSPLPQYAGRHCTSPEKLQEMSWAGHRYHGDELMGHYSDLYPTCTNNGVIATNVEMLGYYYIGREKHTVYKFTGVDETSPNPHVAFTDQISETEL